MDELKKINTKVAIKQIGRLVGGVMCTGIGIGLLMRYQYQYGVTDCQKHIDMEFPEEYASMVEKTIKSFENK